MQIKNKYLAFLGLLFLLGCAAHTNIQPLGKGNNKANIGVGGPIVEAFSTNVPIPYLITGFNYGLENRIDLNGNLHLLPLAYKLFGFDFGTTWYPIIQNNEIPTIGIQPRILFFSSLKSNVESRIRVYPSLSSTAAWQFKDGIFYTGFDLTVPFSSQDFDEESSSTIFSPFLGYCWKLGNKTNLFTELKWNGLNIRSDQLVVDYIGISNHGALGLLFSIERSF